MKRRVYRRPGKEKSHAVKGAQAKPRPKVDEKRSQIKQKLYWIPVKLLCIPRVWHVLKGG